MSRAWPIITTIAAVACAVSAIFARPFLWQIFVWLGVLVWWSWWAWYWRRLYNREREACEVLDEQLAREQGR